MKRRHSSLRTNSKEIYSAYALQQQGSGNVLDGPPVLFHLKQTNIPVLPPPNSKQMYSAYALQQQDCGNVSQCSS